MGDRTVKSCVTVALVPSIKKGPWIYGDPPEVSFPRASALGFDAVELFTASGDAFDPAAIGTLAERHRLAVAAVGTGAGKVLHGLTLTHPDASVRTRAMKFVEGMIDFGARLGAPAIIGSMQGKVEEGVERKRALEWLSQGLASLGRRAADRGVRLFLEPLNRYETDVLNRLGDAAALVKPLGVGSVALLADLFHMNIEEPSIAGALREAGPLVGHLHFADSHRGPVGTGHTDLAPVVEALREIGYRGYASAEAFPWPDPDAAAAQTMKAYRKHFA
jgi:sugar phosphate isomerase/epimerase